MELINLLHVYVALADHFMKKKEKNWEVSREKRHEIGREKLRKNHKIKKKSWVFRFPNLKHKKNKINQVRERRRK